MIRSKDILDYFEADFGGILPGVPLLFDLHLYFTTNRHLMVWRRRGEMPTIEFLDKYRARGMKKVWIHRDDMELYRKYLNPAEADAERSAAVAEVAASDAQSGEAAVASAESAVAAGAAAAAAANPMSGAEATPLAPRTMQGAFIAAVMNSEELRHDHKKAAISETAQTLLEGAGEAQTVEAQKAANEQLRLTVQDVLDATATEAGSLISEILRLCDVDPEFEHAANVATYSVIFAMAFGRIDGDVISDIASAGLLHDVGKSQLPIPLGSIPWKRMTGAQSVSYAEHVSLSIGLIDRFAPTTPSRVKTLIHQHHEKFDGTGYPQRLRGFKVDDLAQLVSMADVLDAISTGQWDGTQRTLKETFEVLQKLEKSRTFPEYFNPEVFAAVVAWIKAAPAEGPLGRASKTVGNQAKKLIRKAA